MSGYIGISQSIYDKPAPSVSFVISDKALGPLRLISSRPLERTVEQVKSRILSRSMADKNSANVAAKMFREKRRWSLGDNNVCTQGEKRHVWENIAVVKLPCTI
ncbi:hypothetical protein BDB01DRAFT_839410 [Pilobolus umbonatus]|nr:hypothetical protein BDB01DRAFT_839410 [Pilobolus umbonatus]